MDDQFKSKTGAIVRVPAGEYEGYFTKAKIKPYRDGKKVYMEFLINKGEYRDKKLCCVYQWYESFGKNSKYYTDWSIMNGSTPNKEDVEMNPNVFLFKDCIVKVRDSAPKYEDGTSKPEMFIYSVIDRVVRLLKKPS